MNNLAEKKCQSCEGHPKPLAMEKADELAKELAAGWAIKNGKQLQKSFEFPDFKTALDFTNEVGQIAEEEGHHPDVFLSYGKVKLEISTHSAGGLTENDFILAAKVDELK